MVAASVALAVGATAGCSQTDRASEPVNVTVEQPVELDAGSDTSGAEPDAGSSDEMAGTEPEPAGADAPAQPDGDGGTDGAGDEDRGAGGSSGSGDEDPGSGGSGDEDPRSGDEAATPARTSPEQFSTGPALEWTEIDPGFDDIFELKSVGDGRVVARAWSASEGQRLFGQRIVVSSNGTDWAEVPMPEGMFPEQVNIAADRWVVASQPIESGWLEEAVDRVFFSDDQGSTWTEMALVLPSSSTSRYALERWRVSAVLVSGEQVVLAVSGLTAIDGQTLLQDVGRLPAGKRVAFAVPFADGVSFTLIDSDVENPYGSVTSTASYLAAVYSHLDEEAWPALDSEELVLTYDEVDFTEAEMFDLFSPGAGPLTRILAGEGSTAEVVAGFEGWVLSGAAINEGFIVTAVDDGGQRVLSSRDGRVWSEDPLAGPESSAGTIAADGTIWHTAFEDEGSFDIQRAHVGEMPATVATFDGLQFPGPLAVGPAGLVVLASRDSSRSVFTEEDTATGGVSAEPELWVGWSGDGRAWGWQTLADAFGIHDASGWAEFAVGDDFVIARVASFQPPDPADAADEGHFLPKRWFRARVP